MLRKRMFSPDVIETDKFLELPLSAQALYFHLGLNGDDEGFVASPRRVLRTVGAADDDFKLLIAKGYIYPFQSGIVVIVDWKIHNYIRADRCTPTIFVDEKSCLTISENKRYLPKNQGDLTLGMPIDNQVSTIGYTQYNIDKNNIDKNNIDNGETSKTPRTRFTPPTIEEVKAYCIERGNNVDPARFIDYYTSNGWMVGKNKMKDWKAAVRTWEKSSAVRQQKTEPTSRDILEMIARGEFDD